MKIRRILQIAATLCCFAFSASAQNISVASFKMDEMDLTANQQGTIVLDQNGEKCALIKVITTQTGFNFDNGSLGITKVEYHTGEVWVYLPAGSRRISISHSQLGQLRDYQFPTSIDRARTYVMELTTGQVHTVVTNAVTAQYVVFRVTPPAATIEIDGHTLSAQEGMARQRLPFGTYEYKVQAPRYASQTGSITVNDPEKRHEITVSLVPQFSQFVFKAPSNAEIWINEEKIGQGQCRVELSYGSYLVETRLPGHISVKKDIILGKDDAASPIVLHAPVPVYGSIDIDSTPIDAEIFIDGKKVGVAPMLVPKCLIGEHNVVLKKSGYVDYSSTVKVEEGRTATFAATLKKSNGVGGDESGVNVEPLEEMAIPLQLVEKQPKFQGGGANEFTKWVNQNMIYPESAIKNRVQGRVMLSFTINKDGNVVNVKVVRGVDPDLDREALRVVSSSPKWTPGTQRGRNVSVTYNFPVVFSLNAKGQTSATVSSPSANVSGANGDVFTVNGISFKMIPVEGGMFSMGATSEMKDSYSDEKPVHSVTLSSFSIGETEVTQELWEAVMGENPSRFKGNQNPVEQVSWDDCQEFISRLNKLTGKKFRLPTEAEWEFAARGGNRSRHAQYSGSGNLGKVAWCHGNSSSKTHPVKQIKANELGLYDMTGNVSEWCNDWYGSYSSNAQTNPTGPTSGSLRVYRGGGWACSFRSGRCSCRYYGSPDYRFDNLGLRLALSK